MIYITSSGRSHDVKTLRYLSKNLYNKITLVVQEKEKEDYYENYKKYLKYGISFMYLPKGIETLEPTRAYVWARELADGSNSKFFLVDDDLSFARRLPGDKKHAHVIPPEDTERMFNLLYSMLDDYAHVGVSEKLGNNRWPENWKYATRCVRVLGYNTKLIPVAKLKFGRIICMSDYDMTLQLLRLGLKNAVSYEYCQEQNGSNHKGGCSAYRTSKVLANSARNLEKFHPEFVTAVWKETKTAWFKAKQKCNIRLDVRVQWKKAYESK